jgi:prepilin-type N-terminal cleavage/methylation domain-containing protein
MLGSKQTGRCWAIRRSVTNGFSLVEILVVIAIIGALVALLLPAVQQARESARRTTCGNNLRQIGIALLSYHDSLAAFPPGCTDRGLGIPQLAWSLYLLPYLEQQNIRSRFNTSYRYDSPVNLPATSQVIPVYLCPSTNRLTNDRDGNFTGSQPLTPASMRACTDYGGMFGNGQLPLSLYANGVMLYDRSIRQSEIVDGLSHTIIVAEDTGRGDATGGSWADGENIFDTTKGVNIFQDNEIWSDHVGAAQVLMCDGSAHFINASVNIAVLGPLCTRANGDADYLIE